MGANILLIFCRCSNFTLYLCLIDSFDSMTVVRALATSNSRIFRPSSHLWRTKPKGDTSSRVTRSILNRSISAKTGARAAKEHQLELWDVPQYSGRKCIFKWAPIKPQHWLIGGLSCHLKHILDQFCALSAKMDAQIAGDPTKWPEELLDKGRLWIHWGKGTF